MAEKVLKSLESLNIKSSGLENFDSAEFKKELGQYHNEPEKTRDERCSKYLIVFNDADFKELLEAFNSRPDYINTPEIKSLWLLTMMALGEPINKKTIFPFKSGEELSNNFAKNLVEIYSEVYQSSKEASKINLYTLLEFLPELVIYFSDFILENKIENHYPELLKYISDTKVFKQFSDKQMQAQQHRLQALYHRRLGEDDKAETATNKYRKSFKPPEDTSIKTQNYPNQIELSSDQTLNKWDSILQECDAIQKEIIEIVGLHPDTCGYFECSDCCKMTFPTMSLTEFRFLKQWLEANNYDIDNLKQKAELIQKEHQKLYGSRLGILDKSKPENQIRGIENPEGFKYCCPFLDDNGRCSCYGARPIMCRGFGLSSDDGKSVKTCNYYLGQYQNNCSHENERKVYDMRKAQELATESDKHLNKNEKNYNGTIVAWFTQEEII